MREALFEDLADLARVMPDVERIDTLSARWSASSLDRRDRWIARRGNALSALIPSPQLTWTVRSTWQVDPFVIRWRLEPEKRPLQVQGSGRITVTPILGPGARVELDGVVNIGSPTLSTILPRRALNRLEMTLSARIEANLTELLGEAPTLLSARSERLAGTSNEGGSAP